MKSKVTVVVLTVLFAICLAGGSIGYFQNKHNDTNEGNDTPKVNPTIVYEYYLEGELKTKEDITNKEINDDISGEETIVKDFAYSNSSCTNGLTGTWDENKWEFVPNDQIDSTCRIYFTRTSYDVTLTITNGEQDPNNKTKIEREKNGEFIINPSEGYEYESSTCSNDKEASWDSTNNKLKINAIMEDVACKVVFKIKSVKMDVTVVNGIGNTTETIEYGKSVSAVVQPNSGFEKPTVACTNEQKGLFNNNTIKIEKLTEDTTCTVTFVAVPIEEFSLEITVPASIMISSGSAKQSVQKGKDGEFKLTPESGFDIDSVSCGDVVPAIVSNSDGSKLYIFRSMSKNVSCTAVAKVK